MGRVAGLYIILVMAAAACAVTTVNISGTVKDGKGAVIAGATVTLVSDTLMKDTTNAGGEFIISNGTAISRCGSYGIPTKNPGDIALKGNQLRFSIASPAGNGNVAIFSGNGKRSIVLPLGKMAPGVREYMLPELAPGFYAIHITIDQSTTTLKLVNTGSGLFMSDNGAGVTGSSRIFHSGAAETGDTLIVKKEGYKTMKQAITSLTQTGIEIVTDTLSSRNRNLFAEVLNKTEEEIDAKLNSGFQQLFHGTGEQPIYYEGGAGAYIYDIASGDVRSEGQSYGMMICVQMDKQEEFKKIWAWTKKVMGFPTFNWQATREGSAFGGGSAPDGEEYIAAALIFAGKRWNNTGYTGEGKQVCGAAKGFFEQGSKIIRFIAGSGYGDPSYVLPSFYEAFAAVDVANQSFWKGAAGTGRDFFHKTCHQTTMLAPYKANFNGTPYGSEGFFNADSWRVVGNIMMDWNFFGVDTWQKETFAPKYAAFMKDALEKKPDVPYKFEIDGRILGTVSSKAGGLVAQNALLGFGLPAEDAEYFVNELWEMKIPEGEYRYYDGCLYLLALLHVSGRFHLYY
jgi:oligosaccharide reducing-end xylanase